MIYVCLCSPVSMMVSPRLLFTQQYCSYSEGGRSSLLSHDEWTVMILKQRETDKNISISNSFDSFYATVVTVKQAIDVFFVYNCTRYIINYIV